jgi:MFS family permease
MKTILVAIQPRRGAFLCLSLSMLLASLGTSIANIALPTLALTFHAPFHQVQWVVIAYLVTLTLSAYVAGRLGDRFGRRRMLVLGLSLFTLASLGCGVAPGLWVLIAARAVQGIGAAFLMTLTIALVRETASGDRIGRAMGLLGTMSAVGTALGPSLGGFLLASSQWRSLFLVLVPLGILAIGLALAALPARDVAAASAPVPSPLRVSVLPGLTGNLLVAAVMMSTLVVGPFYLGLSLGLRAALVGLILSVGPVVSIFSGIPSGRLVDLWGPRRVLMTGLLALAAGAFALAVLPGLFGAAGYIAAIAVLTPGYQLFQAANNTAMMAGVSADQRGAISGLLTLARNLGLVVGASVLGAVFSFGIGAAEVESAAPAAIARGAELTFAVDVVLMLAALWLFRRQRA